MAVSRYVPDEQHWPVDRRDVDRAVTSYWRVRAGWRSTPAATVEAPRKWNRAVVDRRRASSSS